MVSNRRLDPFESARTIGLVVITLVAIGMMLDAAAVGVGLSQASLLSDIAARRPFAQVDAEASDARVRLVAILNFLVFIVTGIVFLVWIHRAHKNLTSFGVSGLEYSPRWAVGGFFVPFLNLIRPFQVTREIWKASNPHPDYVNAMAWQYSASSPLIGAWWGTWILSGVLGRLVATFSRDAKTADSLLSLTYFSIVSDIVNLIPAVLVILLIRAINERQEQKHERMKSFWEQRSIEAEQAAG